MSRPTKFHVGAYSGPDIPEEHYREAVRFSHGITVESEGRFLSNDQGSLSYRLLHKHLAEGFALASSYSAIA